ncbi:hypothetical protein LEMLEM_LOCUS9438 [Lemmus lemmus]
MCLTKSTRWGRGARLSERSAPGPTPPPSPEPRSDQSDGFTPVRPAPARPADRRPPGNPVPHRAAPQPLPSRQAQSQGGARAAGAAAGALQDVGKDTCEGLHCSGKNSIRRPTPDGGFPVSAVSSRCTGQDQQIGSSLGTGSMLYDWLVNSF